MQLSTVATSDNIEEGVRNLYPDAVPVFRKKIVF